VTDMNTDYGPLLSHNGPQQPPPNSPTVQAESPTALTQLTVAAAVGGVFDIKGVHGGFITEATIQYWEDTLGGEKWIKMVLGYLDLERIPPTNGVSSPSYFFQPS